MKLLLASSLLVLGLFALPGAAAALTISAEPGAECFSDNPDKCIGGVYTLEVESTGTDTWRATFTMDLGPGLEIPATTIEQIEFKVAGSYGGISLASAPDATSNWTLVDGPLGGSGCKGKNDSFVCLDAVSPLAVSGTTYTWEIDFAAAGLLVESDWHIGARFASPDHPSGWILSAGTAPIPEPSAYGLFAAGLLVVAWAGRRQLLGAR